MDEKGRNLYPGGDCSGGGCCSALDTERNLTEGKGANAGSRHLTVYSLRSAYWTVIPVEPPALPYRQETKVVPVGLGPRVETSASCSAPLLLTQGFSGSSTHIYSSKSAHGTQI